MNKLFVIVLALFFFGCGKKSVHGCLDSKAQNYNPKANTDNNSCLYDDYVPYQLVKNMPLNPPLVALDLAQFRGKLESGHIDVLTCIGGNYESQCYGFLNDGKNFSVILPDVASYESRILKYDVNFKFINK